MSSNSSDAGRPGLVRRILRMRKLWVFVGAVVFVVALVRWLMPDASNQASRATTYEVRRGNLPITVVEGGNAESLEPLRIKCEVKGRQVKILNIVEEGYRITKEDIASNMILVQLDGSEIEERILQQEIELQTAKASLSKAQQDYEIQEKQNESDLQAAMREVKFKSMDLQKYLGETLANQLMDTLHVRRAADGAARRARDGVLAVDTARQNLEEKKLAADRAKTTLEGFRALIAAAQAEAAQPPDERPMTFGAREEGRLAEPAPPPPSGDAPAGEGERPRGGRRREGGAPGDRAQMAQAMGSMAAMAGAGRGRMTPEDAMARAEALDKAAKEAESAVDEAQAELVQAEQALEDAVKVFQEAVAAARGSIPEPEDGRPVFAASFEPLDFRGLADHPQLEGEAAQKRRGFETDITLAEEERKSAERKLEGTRKLFANDFVTKTELDRDEFAVTRQQISMETKRINEQLFFQYEFPKEAEQAYSLYEEALRKLDRVEREAETKLLSSRVSLDTATARYRLQERARRENEEQLAKCTIYATHEGLVVYGDGQTSWNREPIREGTTVHEQMTLLTIPDTSRMAIKVQIHESAIKKVARGQRARIRVEAFPDNELRGEVTTVNLLPNAERRWMNPDLKTYETTVSIEGQQEWLRPGLTAQVEIEIKELEDVLYVPLQAVSTVADQRVVHLAGGQRRTVETGEFNDKFIEIRTGLLEGDVVMLRPVETDQDKKKDDEEKRDDEQAPPAMPPMQAASARAGSAPGS